MAVIIVTVVSITVIGAITIMISLILYSMSGWQRSLSAQSVAESLADDYLLRLIRDPQLTPAVNEGMDINGASATINHSPAQVPGQPHVLLIKGFSEGYIRTIQILYVVEDDEVRILSRRNIP